MTTALYLIHISNILDNCYKKTTNGIPGMTKVLKEYCDSEFAKMADIFNKADDRIYKIYSGKGETDGLVPYGMMTASVEDPKGKVPEITERSKYIGKFDRIDTRMIFLNVLYEKGRK